MEKVLPKGWVETELGRALTINMGQSPSSLSYNSEGIGVPFMQGKTEFGKVFPTIVKFTTEPTKIVDKNTVLLSVRAPIGPTNMSNVKMCIGRGLAGITSPIISSKFILYYIRSIEGLLDSLGTGTTFKAISSVTLNNIPFLIPPLAEQERIVAKLDALFVQHELMQKALERIPQLLKDFRQQVLTQAIKTEKGNRKLKEFTIDIKYGTSKKSDYEIEGIPILRIPNIENGKINASDIKFSLLDKREFNTLKLIENDILIIRSNGSVNIVGQSAIVSKEFENYSFAGYLIRIRLNGDYNPSFLNHIFKSNFIRSQMIDTSRSTSGVNNINSKEIQELNIPNLSFHEQQEIVRRVESLLAKADAIEVRYQKLKAKIASLPQAILHKAFKGELTVQLPTDGDAKDLLTKIMKLKDEIKGKKK